MSGITVTVYSTFYSSCAGRALSRSTRGFGPGFRGATGRPSRRGQRRPAAPRLRERTAADVEALEDTLVRVSYLAMHLEGHLAELDINPLMVLPSGQRVKAVDAPVVLHGT